MDVRQPFNLPGNDAHARECWQLGFADELDKLRFESATGTRGSDRSVPLDTELASDYQLIITEFFAEVCIHCRSRRGTLSPLAPGQTLAEVSSDCSGGGGGSPAGLPRDLKEPPTVGEKLS